MYKQSIAFVTAAATIVGLAAIGGGVWYREGYVAREMVSSPGVMADALESESVAIIGGWHSEDGASSFGDEIDFFASPNNKPGGVFSSHAYNPITRVMQPAVGGTWRITSAGLTIDADA